MTMNEVEMNEDPLKRHISQLPQEIHWRILSFLEPSLLVKLGLCKKEAWMIFNCQRLKSVPYDTNVDWVSKLNRVTLKVSDKLYVMSLSDLHYHTNLGTYHKCISLSVPQESVFELIPLPAEEGFVFQNTKCVDVPWKDLYSLAPMVMLIEACCTRAMVPGRSALYEFWQRELSTDPHVQLYHDWFRLTEEHEEEFHNLSEHFQYCSKCKEPESDLSDSDWTCDSDMSPASSEIELVDTCGESEIDSIGSEMELDELEDIRSDLSEFQKKIYDEHAERRRKSIKTRWDLANTSQNNPDALERTVYCHYYNNTGFCYFGDNCNFLHKEAPVCMFDQECTRKKCGYYHNPKNDETLAKAISSIDETLGSDQKNDSIGLKLDKKTTSSKTTNLEIQGCHSAQPESEVVDSHNNETQRRDEHTLHCEDDTSQRDNPDSHTNEYAQKRLELDVVDPKIKAELARLFPLYPKSCTSNGKQVVRRSSRKRKISSITRRVPRFVNVDPSAFERPYMRPDPNSSSSVIDLSEFCETMFHDNTLDTSTSSFQDDITGNEDLCLNEPNDSVQSASKCDDSSKRLCQEKQEQCTSRCTTYNSNFCEHSENADESKDGNEKGYNDNRSPWAKFKEDFKLRSDQKFFMDEHLLTMEKYKKRRDKYIKNHPIPASWNGQVPDSSCFPMLFLLSKHPHDMDKVGLKNKRQTGNCVVWKVYEEGVSGYDWDSETVVLSDNLTDILLGIAVMPLNKTGTPYLPISHDFNRPFPFLFGKDEFLGIGDFVMRSVSDKGRPKILGQQEVPSYIKGVRLEEVLDLLHQRNGPINNLLDDIFVNLGPMDDAEIDDAEIDDADSYEPVPDEADLDLRWQALMREGERHYDSSSDSDYV